MSYDESLAERIRCLLNTFDEDFTEKKMFGGLSFLYKGKMTVGIIKDEMAVRVVSAKMGSVLNQPYTKPMDFTNRPMNEFVFVEQKGLKYKMELLKYIELGLEHAKTKV